MELIDYKTGNMTRYISVHELNKIINTRLSMYNATNKRIHLRDAFIFSFLFFSGLRLSEFLLTQVKCIDFENKELFAPQLKRDYWRKELKKKKLVDVDYMTPLERHSLNLTKYVKIPLNYTPNEHLKLWKLYFEKFALSDDDKLVSVSASAIQKRVSKISYDVLRTHHSPHDLRHSCGVYLYHVVGLDLLDVQAILRHAHLGNTEIYARLSMRDVKNKIEQKIELMM
ncbi:site-specific integrase [Methanothermococcus sp.]|uniref:tyrosine-type recombinase/integrase n=1 Tax=Methanothermococcus sp. TaxID=2614238 RepID=UPI0025CB88A1|nr:site-specific integrase [Methanothermococcus sp.]